MINRKLKRFALLALCLALMIPTAASVCSAAIAKTEGVYVYDETDVIPSETETEMNSRAKALQGLTGSQLITVTVKTWDGKDREKFATDLYSEWKLSADKNNSVLILLAIDDQDYFVYPGAALKDKLDGTALREVFDASLEPDFAAGKYGDGAKKTFDDLLGRIEKIYSVDVTSYDPAAPVETSAAEEEESSGFTVGKFFKWFFIIVLILAAILAVIFAVDYFRRPRYVNNGGTKRRHYNTDRGAYVGMPDRGNMDRARRNAQYPQGQRPQGQRPQYPQGQRPQGQPPRTQYPQGQRPQGQQGRPQYPQGQRPQGPQASPQYPQGQRPQGQSPRPQYPQGQPARRPRPAENDHEHPTVYPERAPYVNKDDQNAGGSNRGL